MALNGDVVVWTWACPAPAGGLLGALVPATLCSGALTSIEPPPRGFDGGSAGWGPGSPDAGGSEGVSAGGSFGVGAPVVDSSVDGGVVSVGVGGAGSAVSDAASVPVPPVGPSASAPVGPRPGA